MTKQLVSPIQIPWDEQANLSRAYTRAVKILAPYYVWVPFQDHDVEIITRDWYRRLKQAVTKNPHLGIISCRTNLQHTGNTSQSLKLKEDMNARERQTVADERARTYGERLTVTMSRPNELISGMWFVVHAERYLEHVAPGLPSGYFFGVDNTIDRLMYNAGFPTGIMEGMFVFHTYNHLRKRAKAHRNLPRMEIPPRLSPKRR